MLTPIKLEAPIKDYLWGGNKLKTEFNKKTDLEKVAETWELSCHKSMGSIIKSGEFEGLTLNEYIKINGKNILGKRAEKFKDFPILIKFIDAQDELSIQVHPNDEYALKVEGEYGKNEMWYIMDCDENASIIYGFKKEITKEEYKDRILNGTLLDVLNEVPVKKGDAFFIKSGTIHAIKKGILVAEIQQNSNITYRVYDYNRVDKDGNSRQLHIDKALDVTNLKVQKNNYIKPVVEKLQGCEKKLLSKCDYFIATHYNIFKNVSLYADDNSFNHLLVLDGEFELDYGFGSMGLIKGDSIFIPSGMGEYDIIGNGEIILTECGE